MTDSEIETLAEKILALSKQIEQEIDRDGTMEKHQIACRLAPIFTAILQLSCTAMTPKECFLLYLRIEKLEILSPDNVWFTAQEIGHEAQPAEEALHYVNCGGPSDFALKFGWLKHAYQQNRPLPATDNQ